MDKIDLNYSKGEFLNNDHDVVREVLRCSMGGGVMCGLQVGTCLIANGVSLCVINGPHGSPVYGSNAGSARTQ